MKDSYNITINNGKGYANVPEGFYEAESNVTGYIISSIYPKTVEIDDEKKEYDFTVCAEGLLSLYVTETGRVGSTPIVGAKFIRCDENGIEEYGEEIKTDSTGTAVFLNIPYDINRKDLIFYYKQKSSDGAHIFDDSIQFVIMDERSKGELIANPLFEKKDYNIK